MGKLLAALLQIVAVAVGTLLGGPLGAAIGAAVATGIIALTGLGQSHQKPETSETTVKQSRPPRVSAYGRSRLYGAYVAYESVPAKSHPLAPSADVAVDVYAVHDGRLDGIEGYYLGDDPATLSGNTVNQGADGRYKGGVVKIYTTDGSAPGAGFPAVTALLPGVWSANHRGDGVVALALTAQGVKAKNFQDVYPQSSVPTPSIVARWQRCPDPYAADPLDEAGWTWTENPLRHLLHYKLVREGPKPSVPRDDPEYAAQLSALRTAWWSRRIAPTLDYWKAAADDCDSARALAEGGSEAKYRGCLQHKHTDDHKTVTAALLATFDGWLCPRADGALIVYSGAYYEPTVSIGPDEIVAYTWNGGDVDESEAVNEVVCSYNSAEHDFNTVECDAWRDEADISARGQILSTALDVQTPSYAQSRYLAKRLMRRKNAKNRGTITANIAGRAVQGHRFVNLHLEEAGTVFYSGPVEILGLSRALRGGVVVEWVEADPNIDDWNPAVEQGYPAANGNRIPPAALSAPTVTGLSNNGSRVLVAASGPERDDLTWYVRWREAGGEWSPDEVFTNVGGGDVILPTSTVPPGVEVEVEVSYSTGDGRASDSSTPDTVVTDDIVYDGQVPLA